MKIGHILCLSTFVLFTSCVSSVPFTKYTADTQDATEQARWAALNCHDPKLFQDDDGTYYVYSTDASIGNVHKKGLQLRYSKDLVNWTTYDKAVITVWDDNMLSWMNQKKETASTWAPTIVKQNGKYYMFHGLIADGALPNGPTAWIGLSIADSPFGPFVPAHVYDSKTYSQSTLVRYAWESHDDIVAYSYDDESFSAYIGGEMNEMTVNSITVNGEKKTDSKINLSKDNWTNLLGKAYTGVNNLKGDFTIKYDITLTNPGVNSWEKWAFVLVDEKHRSGWYMRADSYTNNATALNNVAANLYGEGHAASVSYSIPDGIAAANLYRKDMRLLVNVDYKISDGSCFISVYSNGAVIYTAKASRFVSNVVYKTVNTSSFDTKETVGEKTSSTDNWAYGFGCIDPEFVTDMATGNIMRNKFGDYYMTYGSWKGGIALITVDSETFKPTYVDSNGVHHVLEAPLDTEKEAVGKLLVGGEGASYEGAQLIYNSNTGYYYMFVSMGDLTYEYRVGVGRSKDIEGPYLDASARDMRKVNNIPGSAEYYHNVGSKILGAYKFAGERGWRSPGGQSILRNADGKILLANHTRTDFLASYYFYLQIHEMLFTSDGWPVLNMNEYDGNASNGKKELNADVISGLYDVVLTRRSSELKTGSRFTDMTANNAFSAEDAFVTPSVRVSFNPDGSITGAMAGSWTYSGKNEDGNDKIDIEIAGVGSFTGFVMYATDFSRIESVTRSTITFSSISTDCGEYLFGNKRNYR